ncbi:hypothetical protein ACH0B5_03605 [Ureibacillus sp. 179-F W5.1 NHS]|uniref:hypothetical protein n=1 Tax=unclassified Ureibacillus TaxID=2638520 RepID=UPI00311912B1
MSQTVTIRFSDEEYAYLEDVTKEAEQSIGTVIKDMPLSERIRTMQPFIERIIAKNWTGIKIILL